MEQRGPLTGQVALVSGASRGLGRACAVELARAGAHVVCTARSTEETVTHAEPAHLTLEATLAAVLEAGGTGEWHRCDHTDPEQVEAMLRVVLDRHGRLDILVNNAWGGHDHHDQPAGDQVWDEPMDQFKSMLLAGAYSDFVTSMLVLRLVMGPAASGIIITTTWHTPEPPAWVPYESSKAAKNRLVYALGHHLRDPGIPVIAVAPGWMRTELMVAKVPAADLVGRTETPYFAARIVAALAADRDAIRFTGQVVDVGDMADHYGVDDLGGERHHHNRGRFAPHRGDDSM